VSVGLGMPWCVMEYLGEIWGWGWDGMGGGKGEWEWELLSYHSFVSLSLDAGEVGAIFGMGSLWK
jgi:hypothetical protein